MKFAIAVISILLILFILLSIDFYLGRKQHLRLARNETSPLLYGQLDIFPHGKELIADYFKTLEQAKSHIHVLFYIVKNDRISEEFFSILKRKARQGVEVRLLLDRLGSIKVSKTTVSSLRNAGVAFAFSNRLKFPFLFYHSLVRNHRKISIIDGAAGYLGGFNIAKEYIDQDPKLCPWRDYHLKIEGASVSFLQRAFLMDWRDNTGEDLTEDRQYFLKSSKGDIQHQLIATEACGLENSYIKRIRQAENSIFIGTPYFIPSKKIFSELMKAVQRGIDLTIVIPYVPDHILVKEASYRYFRPLLRAGARVLLFKNGFYHAKTIMIDNKICEIGTANFDKRSFFLNLEINCYIYDQPFVKRLGDIVKKDMLDSKPLLLRDLNQPNLFRSFKESIANAISYFL